MRDPSKALHWLAGGGEMSRLIACKSWSETPLGPIDSWPSSLLTTVSLCLASNFPINIIWGAEHVQIYNDGYRVVCGAAHPRALGEPYTVTWASAWPAIGKPFERALAGETSFLENQRMFLERNGYAEETFFTFSLSPIRDESGKVVGIFHPVTETTAAMLSQRRTRALRDLAEKAGQAKTAREACVLALQTLAAYQRDLPMVLLYRVDPGGTARLAGTTGVKRGSPAAPESFPLEGGPWPLRRALDTQKPDHLRELDARLGPIVCGEYPEPLREALILPLPGARGGQDVLVVGVSTRLPMDESYAAFLSMLGNAVRAALGNARTYEEEKQRSDALAEVDRAKTAFFSNVSHEFRTPLTLMLGPLEGMLSGDHGELLPPTRIEVEVIHRNALRLLKLVNALLDFSRIEANRMQASYEPTDLAAFTRELASAFHSAVDRAGMRLTVDVPPLEETVYVDREMWEKIVLNLLSNAFKYTLQGEIRVSLKLVGASVELAVQDTGTGIPAAELPRIFQRFHRVAGAAGRTHEGTGIGLALVHELVKLHGGSVRVESAEGAGSAFTVSVPRGAAHLPEEQTVKKAPPQRSPGVQPAAFVDEALRWTTETPAAVEASPRETGGPASKKRILLADDNADMRDYVRRLLPAEYEVVAVPDGRRALESARANRPDLLLSDIMMPVMDGIELLRTIRRDPLLKTVPVVLLSARAGEEAKASGIEEGADDYLTKPFSAKELLARVRMQLHMSEVRRGAIEEQVRAAALARTIESRDNFLSVVSHELKTPLTSLRIQLQMTQKLIDPPKGIAPPPARLASVVDLSLRQVDRLTVLIEELLTVSKLHAGRMTYRLEPADLTVLARETVERFAEQFAASGCEVTFTAPAPVVATCDRFRVEQVITNLLTNAMKYGAGRPVSISVGAAGGAARITVEDQGMGIPAEKHAAIFERFERAVSHRNISGLGLGLFIARQIVDAHGGEIELWSAPGKGSRFTVVLPLLPAERAMEPERAGSTGT